MRRKLSTANPKNPNENDDWDSQSPSYTLQKVDDLYKDFHKSEKNFSKFEGSTNQHLSGLSDSIKKLEELFKDYYEFKGNTNRHLSDLSDKTAGLHKKSWWFIGLAFSALIICITDLVVHFG